MVSDVIKRLRRSVLNRIHDDPKWKWLTPGIGVKRWILLFGLGVTLIALGMAFVLVDIYRGSALPNVAYYVTLQFLPRWERALVVGVVGLTAIVIAVVELSRSILTPLARPTQSVAETVLRHRQRERGPRIVAIGGGTGLSMLLRGLKQHTSNLTAIVTVADDGGSSGRLRRELGVLPPGDFRNCLAALADDESLTTQLFQYRFSPKQADLDGHALGNLFITAMAEVSGSFERALIESSRVLAITGRILPSALSDVMLSAEVRTADGQLRQIDGESNITHAGGVIERLRLKPDDVRAYPETIRAILEADLVVLGPGSLYTSVLPNLLIRSIPEALRASRGLVMYVCNVATQHGETDGYTVHDHVRAIERHIGPDAIDVVLANARMDVPWVNSPEGVGEIVRIESLGGLPQIATADVIDETRPWRHDSRKLAQAVLQTFSELRRETGS